MGDPENLGSALRICAAFNVSKIFLFEEACNPFLPKVIRASVGLVFDLTLKNKIFYTSSISNMNLINEKVKNYFALDSTKGENLKNIDFNKLKNINIILGQEGKGLVNLKENINLQKVSINTPVKIESLNASVCLSISFKCHLQLKSIIY